MNTTVNNITENNVAEPKLLNTFTLNINDGIDYGNTNIHKLKTVDFYDNGDMCASESFFHVNGYNFQLDYISQYSIKCYLLKEIPTYRNIKNIDKVLSQRVNFKADDDALQYIKIRTEQLNIFLRGLIKGLRKSKHLKDDLNIVFGMNPFDFQLPKDFFNYNIICNWKDEWKEDYSTAKYKL